MRFPPALLDEIRARLPVSQVVGRKVALKRAGRELKGLSPFKVEKTPSFYVNDVKGFYHCFASGEHGDIFKFVMETEGLSFPEAVERLASEAGIALPKPAERDPQREDERVRLLALLEASATFFELQLRSPTGEVARRYLAERRGLAPGTIDEFRLGYAPAGRSVLKDHLARLGYSGHEMVLSGILIGGDDIPVSYDRFRHRVMFPIGDHKGRIVAFGGRALEADVPAKYLNSPETPLFHKGHLLFNAARARPAAFERQRIVVVEGYMDVIALAQAGFANAVAPLGTALTEQQIELLWRMVPEPILCFDGDSAGRKAAFRAVDTVLPRLEPGRSLSFAFLPSGLDPDDLARQQGPAAVAAVLDRARPLAEVLFEKEVASGDWSTPERRARLDQQLGAQLRRIEHPSVRSHYADDMRRRLDALWGRAAAGTGDRERSAGRVSLRTPAGGGSGGRWGGSTRPGWRPDGRRPGAPPGTFGPDPRTMRSASLRSSPMVGGDGAAPPYREALMLRTVLNHPWLLEQHAETLAELELTSPVMRRLRDAVLATLAHDNSLDRGSLASQLAIAGLEKALHLVDRAMTHRADRFADPDAAPDEVDAGWRDALGLHRRHVALRKALDAAEQSYHASGSEEDYARICEIQHAIAVEAEAPAGQHVVIDEALDRRGATRAAVGTTRASTVDRDRDR